MRPVVIVLLCIFFSNAHAQKETRWLLGTGITYCSYIDNPGLNLNITYRVFGNFHVGPDFSALLTRELQENGKVVKRKEVEYNFNAQQLFEVGEKIALYPLVGINWSRVTRHPEGEEPFTEWITAVNAGGGCELQLNKFRLFAESKWVSQLDKYDLTAGILFPL